jgi:hypothetical protein
MNWIINRTELMPYHTYLPVILKPLEEYIDKYNWVFSELEYSSVLQDKLELPINLDEEYFVLSPQELQIILDNNVQFWWATILAIPSSKEIILDENHLPFAEFNDVIWKNGNLQNKDAEIEIDCFDSSYTIVKFKNKVMSDSFKSFFGKDAIALEEFK